MRQFNPVIIQCPKTNCGYRTHKLKGLQNPNEKCPKCGNAHLSKFKTLGVKYGK